MQKNLLFKCLVLVLLFTGISSQAHAYDADWLVSNFPFLKKVTDVNSISKDKTYFLIAYKDTDYYVVTNTLDTDYGFLATKIVDSNFELNSESYKFKFYKSSNVYHLKKGSTEYYVNRRTYDIVTKQTNSVGSWTVNYKPDFGLVLGSEDGHKNLSMSFPTTSDSKYFKLQTSCNKEYPGAVLYEYDSSYVAPAKVGTINIATAEGYGTIYCEKSYVMPDGITGYTITDANVANGDLTLNPAFQSGDIVPAKAALLVKGNKGEYSIYAPQNAKEATCRQLYSASDLLAGNLLLGTATQAETVAPATAAVGDSYLFYKLYYLTEVESNTKQLGFFWGAENGGPFQNGANKAYLALKQVQSAEIRGFVLPENGHTGICTPLQNHSAEQPGNIYTIDGIKVNARSQLKKGLYITHGKKILVK